MLYFHIGGEAIYAEQYYGVPYICEDRCKVVEYDNIIVYIHNNNPRLTIFNIIYQNALVQKHIFYGGY